jgi:hypothetical protein
VDRRITITTIKGSLLVIAIMNFIIMLIVIVTVIIAAAVRAGAGFH